MATAIFAKARAAESALLKTGIPRAESNSETWSYNLPDSIETANGFYCPNFSFNAESLSTNPPGASISSLWGSYPGLAFGRTLKFTDSGTVENIQISQSGSLIIISHNSTHYNSFRVGVTSNTGDISITPFNPHLLNNASIFSLVYWFVHWAN